MNQKVNYSGFVDLLFDDHLYAEGIQSDNTRLKNGQERRRDPRPDTLGRQGGNVVRRGLHANRTE